MKVLQINTTYAIGSTGRIVSGIDNILKENRIESYVAYGYGNIHDKTHYKIINQLDSYTHNIKSRLSDSQGLHSTSKTKKLIRFIDSVAPDIIHLHNLHGNYLDYRVLFEYLLQTDCKVIWTLHDCWPITGHCAYFDIVGCEKWKSGCKKCPQRSAYPPSLTDRSQRNYAIKSELFTKLMPKLTLVPVSNWLSGVLHDSFLGDAEIKVIHNGINLDTFTIQKVSAKKPYILGVAYSWDERKGLSDFIKLREYLTPEIGIKLVGIPDSQKKNMPEGISTLQRTESIHELAAIYSGASVFVNTTYEDNYPTVNLEAIACGTPVVTYRTGGSPESVGNDCGLVVDKGDVKGLATAVETIMSQPHAYGSSALSEIARNKFDEKKCFLKYIELYRQVTE